MPQVTVVDSLASLTLGLAVKVATASVRFSSKLKVLATRIVGSQLVEREHLASYYTVIAR